MRILTNYFVPGVGNLIYFFNENVKILNPIPDPLPSGVTLIGALKGSSTNTGRHSGLMVRVLDSGSSGTGFGSWPGTLCCVLGQDT